MIRKLARSLREYKKYAIVTLIFMVLEASIECVIPFITAMLVNKIKAGAEVIEICKVGIVLVIMAMCSLACGGGGGYTCSKASAGFAKNLRKDVFVKVQNFTFTNIDKFSATSLVTRMTTDITYVQMSFMMIIRTAIRSPLMFIFSIVMAYIMGGALSLSFVIIIPILIFGLIIIGKKAMPAFKAVFKKYDALNESIEENVRGMRVVKGFSREEYEKEKFGSASEKIREDFTKADKIIAFNGPIMQFCLYFNMIFVLFVGAMISIKSGGTIIDVGELTAMLTYAMQILMALMMLSMIYVMITMSAESAKRICEVLDELPDLESPANPVMEVANGSIEFKNVSFKYSKKAQAFALQDVNLEIPTGSTVGIIGGTGSSKSTLVQLIPRLYDTTIGEVLVGGVNVKDYDIETLRSSVSMVLQKNMLFSGTIKENLRWGNKNATDEELIEACKLAEAHDFIMSFPDQYDTKIEQGGTNVSGGQKQRLCIARALLKKPQILILDDSTSAVDTKTDALIRAGFKKFIPTTTKIIIAQRIASVEDADLIIVMDNGKIDAIGKHDYLLENCDIYKEVCNQQKNGGVTDEE